MKQLQAGYIIDSIGDYLSKEFDKEKVDGLLKQLSYFDVEVDASVSGDIVNPEQILYVANSLISRGLPTRMSLDLENKILDTFEIATINDKHANIGSIKYDLDFSKYDTDTKESFGKKLYRVIHIIEPRISLKDIDRIKIDSQENHLGSEFEEDFLYNKLPSLVSPFWVQLFESQRELESILRFSTSTEDEIDKYLSGSINIFNEQRVDFSLEFPYQIFNQRGVVVEIDGSQHEERVQKNADTNRDNATEKAKWKRAIRIKTNEWNSISTKLKFFKELENEEFFKLLKENYFNPLYKNDIGAFALQLLLVPFSIARIQKVIIDLLLNNQLDITKKEWNIAVLERDITGSKLAIDDFKRLLNSLFELKGDKIKLPEINLFVESSPEFENFKLCWTKHIDRKKKYDLFIDLSILQRSYLQSIDKTIDATIKINIRSSHSPKTDRKFFTTQLIRYKALGKKNNKTNKFHESKSQVRVLEKFINDVFRKESFRPGQVEIIDRALRLKNVIGLLPTGSGKSLTYQLAVLLQPGLSIVVDPIKSLMKDQYDGLLKNKIDCSVYINSSLTLKGRQHAIAKINKAATLFAFISPERLQDHSFRKQLIETSELNENYFSYCVIDEAHCVSEWGHDFRTSYLRLGDNVRNYCKVKDRKGISFLALTATASYDVLADIQRELKIFDDSAIVRLDNLNRPELQFNIKEVVADINSESGLGFSNKERLGQAKQDKLISKIKNIPSLYKRYIENDKIVDNASNLGLNIVPNDFSANGFFSKKGEEKNAGLIFCPHRKWYFGVTDNASNINQKIDDLSVEVFMGSDGDDGVDFSNTLYQERFINNEIDLLVATKAFGMGIDKPNIRYVVHLNYPSSIESYYQEVGRAGRDRKIAIGVILFNHQEVEAQETVQRVTEDGEITEELQTYQTTIDRDILQSFHRNNFKGIEKEKFLLAELLTEIKYPTKRVTNELEDRILENFEVTLQLRTYINKNNREVLYLNPNYGSIYLDTNNLSYYQGDDSTAQTVEIATFIREFIKTKKPNNISTFNWLNQFTQTSKQDGIEKILNSKDETEKFIVIIPFTNNAKEKIATYLQSNNIYITERMVDNAQEFCGDIDTFISNLKKEYRKAVKGQNIDIPNVLHPKLKRMFLQIRGDQDTYKAIYRLSIIGVVDDYTVDYNSKTVSAYISRKPPGHYTQELKKYLLQYNSIEKVEKRLLRLQYYKGGTEIQKCLGFLIKFIYEEIAEQRKESIKAMEQACKIGLQENGGERFKEFIDLYMNSKYARPEYLPEDTDHGLKEDFNIVAKYMEKVRSDRGGEINNLKHLRGASTVLLVQRPDNYVFILLRAFSVIIIEKGNDSFIKEGQLDFYNGFLKLSESNNEDVLSVQEKVRFFKQKLRDFDTDLAHYITEIEDVLYHKIHTNWIEKFNAKFIGEHEGKN